MFYCLLRPKNGKKCWYWEFLAQFFAIFRSLTGNKTSPNYLFLVEEVLSFDLVGHMWKSVKNWLQKRKFDPGEIFLPILELSLSNIT